MLVMFLETKELNCVTRAEGLRQLSLGHVRVLTVEEFAEAKAKTKPVRSVSEKPVTQKRKMVKRINKKINTASLK